MSYRIRCTNSHSHCMRFCGRIKSLKNCGHVHYSDVTECNPNYCNAAHKHWYECLTTFCVLAKERCTIFKDSKIGLQLFLCVLCDHETVAQHVSCNLATFYYHCKIYWFQFTCFATKIYWIQGSCYFRFSIRFCLVLNLPQ